ncbi:MAG: PhoX family protein [Burkholderiaceae bacterium]|nr:PhoX family protein [Burkholderiaceae bacterium]
MSDSLPNTPRRRILKLLAGTPVLLPLGVTATSMLTACSGDGGGDAPAPADPPATSAQFESVAFAGMSAPAASDPAALAATSVRSRLQVAFSDGSVTEYALAYQPFFLTGDQAPDGNGGTVLAGGYYDIDNQPIMDAEGRRYFSNAPDGASLLTVAGAPANTVFAVVQFEYANWTDFGGPDMYGVLPSPIAVLTLNQNPATGQLTLAKYHNVDMSAIHGLWIPCGASLSPWGTHISSEEYEPDAFDMGQGGQSLSLVTDADNGFGKWFYGDAADARLNAYNYGHIPEVTVNPDGTGAIKKHYCLGRISHELIQVMPDERTALMGDDYTNGGLFMFVADRARDLSSGTLYVARYTSVLSEQSTSRASAAAIQWIKLGSATSAEIEAMVNTDKIQPTDIMDVRTEAAEGYTPLMLNKTERFVRLAGDDERTLKAAAFLETHRYAALKGGSMGFTKMEGTAVNARDKIAYSAIANITDSMVAGRAGYVSGHNIRFAAVVNAGCVLQHFLAGGQTDSDGNAIDSEWVPQSTAVLITGTDLPAADALGNTSDPDNIASPDNLKFSEQMRTLFIGEDSGNHTNNFLWAWHVDTGSLQRLLSCPAGAESTGLHAVDALGGWTYIMSNFQHAGDGVSRLGDLAAEVDELMGDKRKAAVGYLTGDFGSAAGTAVKL